MFVCLSYAFIFFFNSFNAKGIFMCTTFCSHDIAIISHVVCFKN